MRIARHELSAVRHDVENAGAGRLVLNVAHGAHFDVVVERTAPTKWGYSLSGRVAGGGVGFVTLVVHEDAVAGSIWTPEAEYELSSLGGGVHALRDVTNAPPIECGGALPTEHVTDQGGTNDGDDGSVVDILVVWTPEAEDELGGSGAPLLQIDYLIAWANDAFERSGALVSLNLVGAEKVDYAEVDSTTDLIRLAGSDDGYMDGVHDRRDVLGADLIYLLTGRYGGRAIGSGAFSIGGGGLSPVVFAHEIGHNFGISHERVEASTAATRAYEHGFTTESCRRTIMSYGVGECPYTMRRPVYASPWRYDFGDGRPLGVTRFSKVRGAGGPADAVLTLNRNRPRVVNYRPSRDGREL